MKIKETQKGKTIIFKNKFSVNRVEKNDRKLDLFLKTKYKLIKLFRLDKFYRKKSWFDLMDFFLNRFNNKENEEEFHSSVKGLKLQNIVLYDLLPKEYLSDYQNKYIRFRTKYMKKHYMNRNIRNIRESFSRMANHRGEGNFYNVDLFWVKEGTSLGNYFQQFSLQLIGLCESFYIIKYKLNVNENANKHLEQILETNSYKEPQCVSSGRWWKKNSFAGLQSYDEIRISKKYEIENFSLELKESAFKLIKKKLITKVFDWDNIMPSIEVYSTNNLNENILTFIGQNFLCGIEHNLSKSLYFIPSNEDIYKKSLNSSVIIAKEDMFENQDYSEDKYPFCEKLISKEYADFFLLDGLRKIVDKKIYDSHLKINKIIQTKRRMKSSIRLKLSVEKELYLYRRLYEELSNDKYKEKYNKKKNKHYNKIMTNKEVDEKGLIKYPFNFENMYEFIFDNIQTKNNLINKIYLHFEENSKMIESYYNYTIVKWTLIIGLLTLLVTILFAENSYLLNSICEFIKKLFR